MSSLKDGSGERKAYVSTMIYLLVNPNDTIRIAHNLDKKERRIPLKFPMSMGMDILENLTCIPSQACVCWLYGRGVPVIART